MVYEDARDRSKAIFGNAHLLPIAEVIGENVEVGSDFTAPDVRAWISGHAADNQIHAVLKRLETAEALEQLPYPGQSHPRRWMRIDHPLWRFVAEWATVPAKQIKR